jgi:hypothetical protein
MAFEKLSGEKSNFALIRLRALIGQKKTEGFVL